MLLIWMSVMKWDHGARDVFIEKLLIAILMI